MRCFLAFFSCWRWESALLSAIHRIQLFPRIFKYLPFDYRAKNGIYSYIYWCFTPLTTWTSIDMFIIHTCFGEALFSLMKKKTKKTTRTTNKLWRANHWMQLFVASKYRLRSNGRKVVKHFFSSSKKRKNCHTVSLIGSTCLCFVGRQWFRFII